MKNKTNHRSTFMPNALASGIGSLPYKDPNQACHVIWDFLPDIPFWPQLPKRSPLENMYRQYSEGLPGIVAKEDGGFYIQEQGEEFYKELEGFYQAFLSEDLDFFKISKAFAQGFYTWIEGGDHLKFAAAIKGQITGPISFGLQVTQSEKRPIIYNDTLRDVLIKLLSKKAQWQLSIMRDIHFRPIMFLDEPYLAAFGSAFTSLDRNSVISTINEVVHGIDSITAIHCCGNTDWSLILETDIDILSFDAYSFMETLSLYQEQLKGFLDRGGIIAWGIVPTDEPSIRKESVKNLISRLEKGWNIVSSSSGMEQERLIMQSMITPACGLGTLSIAAATEALRLTKQISIEIRNKYHLCW